APRTTGTTPSPLPCPQPHPGPARGRRDPRAQERPHGVGRRRNLRPVRGALGLAAASRRRDPRRPVQPSAADRAGFRRSARRTREQAVELMSVILVGVPQFTAALDALVAAAGEATKIAVIKGGHLIQAETQKKLTTSSHKKGTPTPSQPGEPPSLVTGQLRRSIRTDHPNRGGDGIWSTRIGPTAAYGRI